MACCKGASLLTHNLSFKVIEETIRMLQDEQKREKMSQPGKLDATDLTELIAQAARKAAIWSPEGSRDLRVFSCGQCGAV